MHWDDIIDICGALNQQPVPIDIRGMTQEEIVALVVQLPGFRDDSNACNAGQIEAIRASAWWGV